VVIWLGTLCAMVVGMVVIGGITRLTGSGLSMVEWSPLLGAIPPLSDADWRSAFERYQRFPQYKLVNAGMTLGAFKAIFFWEYLHRLVGRLIGVVFILPWLWLTVTRRVDGRLSRRLAGGLVLGGMQGALGWFMVKSGLVDQPAVSHFRLAAHLVLALVVLAYLLWLLLDLWPSPPGPVPGPLHVGAPLLLALVLLQIVYGAFTAGMKAGYGYNTFPTMNGEWIPSGATRLAPLWTNLFENPTAVQFLHRTFGWSLLFATVGVWLFVRSLPLRPSSRRSLGALTVLVSLQFVLGVATLLMIVPVGLAVLHQFCACLVFTSAVVLNHSVRSSFHGLA
jgi:cytochrome c oxidase assembly protein subunit 15